MTSQEIQRSFPVMADEKVTSVMVYTINQLIWGEVVTKEALRISTWLRTQAVPQFLCVHDAHIVIFGGSGSQRPILTQEIHQPTSQIIAFHIKPPSSDPLDYDPNEPMRKMEPVSVLLGWFRFDGYIRMSVQSELGRYLDVSKEPFTSLYDVNIHQLSAQAGGAMRVPLALVRSDSVSFSRRLEQY